MDRKTFSELIDAYAAAKVSQNQILQKMIVGRLQEALDAVFTRLEALEASQLNRDAEKAEVGNS